MNKNPEKFAIEYLIRNGYKLDGDYNNYARQVVRLAIEALEKQIPKVAGCDICNDTSNWRYYRNKKYKYCPNCGQKLDWSVEE